MIKIPQESKIIYKYKIYLHSMKKYLLPYNSTVLPEHVVQQ